MQRALACLLVTACSDEPVPDVGITCGDGVREDFELCDDGNVVSGDGCTALCAPEPLVTVTWAFFPSVMGPAMTGACRAGVATVELVTEVNTTAPYPCDERRSGTVYVPSTKQVFARLRAANGDIVAESLPVLATSGWRADAPFYEDAGYVRASFRRPDGCLSLFGPDGQPQLQPIELVLAPVDGGTSSVQTFPCSDDLGLVTSAPVAAGIYDVALTNAYGETIIQAGVVVRPNNGVTDLDFR